MYSTGRHFSAPPKNEVGCITFWIFEQVNFFTKVDAALTRDMEYLQSSIVNLTIIDLSTLHGIGRLWACTQDEIVNEAICGHTEIGEYYRVISELCQKRHNGIEV